MSVCSFFDGKEKGVMVMILGVWWRLFELGRLGSLSLLTGDARARWTWPCTVSAFFWRRRG